MTTTLSIRLDNKLKSDSQKVFKELGLDISSATKLFLTQVVNRKAIPFEIRTVNGFTPAFEQELLDDIADIKKNPQNYKAYSDVKELMSDLGL